MDKKILELLEQLVDKVPEQRFGQILFNYTPIGTRVNVATVKDPFHYNDDTFIEYLEYHLENSFK